MDEVLFENNPYMLLDKCKCCLGDGQLKDLWVEYCEDGKKRIYGEMLIECFDLSDNILYNKESEQYIEKICEACICRLKNALEFKQEVLACAQLQYEHLNNGFNLVKKEVEDFVEEKESSEGIAIPVRENESDSECSNEQNFEDVEYLEIDEYETIEEKPLDEVNSVSKSKNTAQNKDTSEAKSISPVQAVRPTKWPKKKKYFEQKRKQYTRSDMLKAMETVRNGLLSTKNAALEFNVPRRTLATYLYNAENGKDISDKKKLGKSNKKEEHYQFIEEVKKILTYTNAVPFKTKATRYFCTYCSTDGPCFEDPDDLRAHTRTQHVDDKTRNIEMVLRPQFMNEVIKMDIDALHCTVCCIVIPTWSAMFKHLEESHNIELDEAYTRVIPYILKSDLKCALCSESFPNYHHLDAHMNSHYASYICSDCGEAFLSASRFRRHITVHNTGEYPCEACGKVFARDGYRQKHFDHVHKQEHNIKCWYCTEKFYGTFQRHLHMVEKHKEKVSVTTCELCGMRFEWRQYYVAHMRKKHNIRTNSFF